MQVAHVLVIRLSHQGLMIEAQTDLDVLLRKVVAVNQHLADLVGGVGILAFVRVAVLDQEVAVTMFDDGF